VKKLILLEEEDYQAIQRALSHLIYSDCVDLNKPLLRDIRTRIIQEWSKNYATNSEDNVKDTLPPSSDGMYNILSFRPPKPHNYVHKIPEV
jgi:hypothetical protein